MFIHVSDNVSLGRKLMPCERIKLMLFIRVCLICYYTLQNLITHPFCVFMFDDCDDAQMQETCE